MEQNLVGKAIAQLRADMQLTVEQFAERMGVSKRAFALAMGIAVTVLFVMNRMDSQGAITMLGIGMTCIGIASLSGGK